MKHYFCLLAILLCGLTAAPSVSPQTQRPQQNERVLPHQLGSWTCKGTDVLPATPFLPEINKEAGQTTSEACEYSSGATGVQVKLDKYGDPSGAYEAYTAYLNTNMQPSILGPGTAIDKDLLIALEGDFVLSVQPTPNISAADLQTLAQTVNKRANPTPLPPIRTFLPGQGLVQGTQRYALGPAAFRAAAESLGKPDFAALADLAGFAKGAEAMVGRYGQGAVLILIDYPTPQLAELYRHHLEPALPESAKAAGMTIERKDSLLSIVTPPATPLYARTLRGSIDYGTQLTWNEPSATATDPPWSVILYHIFLGTGVFMIMAVAFGIAFGGVRIFVKRLLPGKVFDRPERMEVLQLGLSGKTIDPRDFY
jgi:uncharacterized protein DUF6599